MEGVQPREGVGPEAGRVPGPEGRGVPAQRGVYTCCGGRGSERGQDINDKRAHNSRVDS